MSKTYKKNKSKKNKTKKIKKKNKVLKTILHQDAYLYDQPSLLDKGMLEVSKIHTIAYFTYGNKQGKPVLVVHGGPGGGTTPDMARFFNPNKYYIILVDQRGCGKSIPFGEIKENKTNFLVEDFEKMRKHLNIKKLI